MRQRHLALAIAIAFTTSLCSWGAPVEYTHPKKDVESGTCVVTSEGVTYHSMGYPSTPPTYYGGWVSFTSENEGDPVSITFTDFNCLRGQNPVVYVYDGDTALKAEFPKYNSDVPAGYLAVIRPENAGTKYTAPSGKLCVLYAPASKSEFVSSATGSITGTYTASVTAGVPKDMEYLGAEATNAGVAAWRGAKDVALLTLTVRTEGNLNPMGIDNLTVDLGAVGYNATNIRLVSGSEVLATAADGAGSLSATVPVLRSKTELRVLADILPDAAGTVGVPTVSSLIIGGESRTVESDGADIAVANSIRMSADGSSAAYTIGSEAPFYDAGGPEGAIPLSSEGYVTFVPATEGMRIQVDITSLALFNTSSVGYNDVFRFYNGHEAIADSLIADVLDEGRTVKSSAPDGSMTVYFKSVQGNASQARAGWEALVSQFTPTEMTIASVQCAMAETGSVYAGREGVRVFTVNVATENQLSPLSLQSLSLTASDSGMLGKVRVYGLGGNAAGTSADLFGEGEWQGGALTVSGTRELAEGDNFFAVEVDMAPACADGSTVELTLTDVSAGGTTGAPAGQASATLTVDNTCHISEGTHSHLMYGDWRFSSPVPEGYSSNYPAGKTDCVVTFRPTAAGARAQIEFETFDVYYSASSYGEKAVFEVYSGDTTAADALIWKLSSNSEQSTGPGRKLRSTAADGTITVRFNPNASSSYYTAKGWNATVTQFIDHDATVSSVSAGQVSEGILAPGAAGERLIDFDIVTEGSLSPLTISGFNFRLTGAEALSRMCVYRGDDFAGTTLWGEAVPEDETLNISYSGDGDNAPLAEEHNRFYVTVDVKNPVASDIVVDAALTGYSVAGGQCVTVSGCDPEGSRITKNIYICEEGEHTVTVGAPILFYDEGGPDGPVTKGFKGTVTFVPDSPDAVLSLGTQEMGLGTGRIVVYSGHEVSDANRLGASYYSGANGPENLVSKADDGSLTIVYTAPSYIYGTAPSGFALSVTPLAAVPYAIAGAVVSDASELDVVRGSQEAPVARVAVEVAGTKGALEISELKADFGASTSVADITGTRLYYTGTTDGFSTTSAVSPAVTLTDGGEAVYTLAEPVRIDEAGTYYLWIGADLSSNTEPGNTVAVAVNSIGSYTIADSNTASRTIVSGMGGTYRVGPSDEARYHTIASAVAALSLGVESPVVFQLEDGTYAENISIADVAGTSELHPVTFTSLSGDRDKVVIAGASSNSDRGMVTVERSSYIRFSNLTLNPSQSGFAATVLYTDGSRGGLIDNCVVRSAVISGATSGSSVIRTSAGSEGNSNCDNFTVNGSYIEGGYIGIYAGGSGYVNRPKDTGLRLTGNTVANACSKGMYIYDCESFEISGNTVTAGDNARKSYNGMDIYRPTGAYVIASNRITDHVAVDNTGIYVRMAGGSSDAANPARIVNNVVNINAAMAYTYGIMFGTQQVNTLIAHNTVRVSGASTTGSCYAITFRDNAPAEGGARIVNNIFVNSTRAGALGPWNDTHYANLTFAGNVYYGNNDIVDGDGKTLAEYQEATGDLTSVWYEPQFVGDLDLHLLATAEPLMRARLAEVCADADGRDRSESTEAGAYAYAALATGKPEIAEGYPAVGAVSSDEATVNTCWTIGGTLYGAVYAAGAEAPDAEALQTTAGTAVDADTAVPTVFRGLSEQTAYRAAFMVVSALGEVSDVVLSPEFTTEATIYPLTVDMNYDDDEAVESGASVTLMPVIEGGKQPLTYLWTNRLGDVCGNESTLSFIAGASDSYRIHITSADGQTATAKAHVPVICDEITVADFEDLALESESNWMFDPDVDEDTYFDSFFSGSFRFPNYPMKSYNAWCGFGFANETATGFEGLEHQFRNVVGGGADGSNAYGVAYLYGANATITVCHGDTGHNVNGVYITNSAYALSVILNGNALCDKFTSEAGDYMTVSFTGYDADGNQTGVVEAPLADYRTRDEAPYLLTDWKWIDLSSLGAVNTLRVNYDSSKRSQVPAYVCFDKLGSTDPAGNTPDGIGTLRADGSITITRPTPDCISVLGTEGRYMLDIYSTSGALCASYALEGPSTVGVGEFVPGYYIATVRAEGYMPVSARIAIK